MCESCGSRGLLSPRSLPQNTVAMARSRRKNGDGEAELRPSKEPVDEEENGKKEEYEEEEEEEEEQDEEEEEEITEYEKQRLRTIERNKAMLASLQLPNLASSLAQASKAGNSGNALKSKGGGPRRRSERLKSVSGKRSAADDDTSSSSSDKSDSESESLSPNKRKRKDQEYEPTDEENSASESEDDMDEHEKEALQEDDSHGVDMNEEEYALQQALALSLGASVEGTNTTGPSKKNKKRSSAKKRAAESAEPDPDDELEELEDNPKSKPSKSKAKRKTQKMSNKRHFTEEEVDGLFPFFDEKGRGRLTLDDLERVSTAHDFTWNAQELLDMIHLFNRGHTSVLDLVDFRNVATRCNLIFSER